jgi:hypothetical protein
MVGAIKLGLPLVGHGLEDCMLDLSFGQFRNCCTLLLIQEITKIAIERLHTRRATVLQTSIALGFLRY